MKFLQIAVSVGVVSRQPYRFLKEKKEEGISVWFQENLNKRLINWDWMPLVNNCALAHLWLRHIPLQTFFF